MKRLSITMLLVLLAVLLVVPIHAEPIYECGLTSGGGLTAQTITVEYDLNNGDSLNATVSGTQARITITKLPQRVVASSNGFQTSPTVSYTAQSNNARYRLVIEMLGAEAGYSYSYSFCRTV